MTDTFPGYRRADGRVGVRNVVAILSAMDNTNPSAERIASMVSGTAVLATPFGRGQIGADSRSPAAPSPASPGTRTWPACSC